MDHRKLAALAALCAPGAQPALAQDAIGTDRPGFSTGPDTVGLGTVQVEAGFEWSDASNQTAFPLALLRYGVGEATEVRLTWNGVSVGDGPDGTLGGSVAVKHALAEGDGLRPALGLLAAVSIPAGSDPLDPEAGFLWSLSPSEAWSVFGTATVGLTSSDGSHDVVGTNAVGVSRTLGPRAGVFVEHFVSWTEGDPDQTHYVDGGLTYLVTDDLQLDVNAGVSVGDTDAGTFVGGGLACRF